MWISTIFYNGQIRFITPDPDPFQVLRIRIHNTGFFNWFEQRFQSYWHRNFFNWRDPLRRSTFEYEIFDLFI